jgi:uncharacterized membrane protein YhaH (DUF805 family)
MTYLVDLLLSLTGRISRKSWLDFVIVCFGNLTVKRCNDRDRSGWLGCLFAPTAALFYLAPHFRPAIDAQSTAIRVVVVCLAAACLLFAFVDNGFFRGTEGPDRYGPDPLAGARQPA